MARVTERVVGAAASVVRISAWATSAMSKGAGVTTVTMWLASTTLLTSNAWAGEPTVAASTASDNSIAPSAWLERMSEALRTTSFRGRSIYLSGDQLTAVEILHGVFNGEPWERVVHLSGEPAEIVRKGSRVASLHPDGMSELKDFNPTVSAAVSYPQQWNTAQYRLSEGPDDRIAGRTAKRIDVLPIDRYRYGVQLWLDQNTALLLKSVIVDQRGRALDMFEFVSLDTSQTLKAEDFEPGNGLQWLHNPNPKTTTHENNAWKPGWLPVGFKVSSHVLRPTESAVYAQSYSDGLAAFTLFVEPLATDDAMEGTRQLGATVAVSYRAPPPNDAFRVTVVGEIPLETAMQVASSLSRTKSE